MNIRNGQTVKVLPIVPSLERHENFPEAVLVVAKMPLALPSSEGHGKLGSGSKIGLSR